MECPDETCWYRTHGSSQVVCTLTNCIKPKPDYPIIPTCKIERLEAEEDET